MKNYCSSSHSTPQKTHNQSLEINKKYNTTAKKFDFHEYKASLDKLLLS